MHNREQIKRRTSDTITQNVKRDRNTNSTMQNFRTMDLPENRNNVLTNKIETNNVSSTSENRNDTLEKPQALNNRQTEITVDKTNDILNQINSYLENEKKNLKN